jgi:hypothetical protein
MITQLLHLPLVAQALAVDSGSRVSGLLEGIDADKRFALLIVAIGCGTGIILGTFGILSSAINSLHRRRAEMDLKRDMIERGMSADEIARIIECAAPPDEATERLIASWAKKKSC